MGKFYRNLQVSQHGLTIASHVEIRTELHDADHSWHDRLIVVACITTFAYAVPSLIYSGTFWGDSVQLSYSSSTPLVQTVLVMLQFIHYSLQSVASSYHKTSIDASLDFDCKTKGKSAGGTGACVADVSN